MAFELATRNPLAEKPHSTNSTADHLAEVYVPAGAAAAAERATVPMGSQRHAFAVDKHNYPHPGLVFAYNSGFRYQIRRPVESWKFVETKKQDGSVLYLCRVCSSSYKHKKSLNKHWKDKHNEVPRPEGAQPDEEEDEEDEDEEDGAEDDEEYNEGDSGEGRHSLVDVENVENVNPKAPGRRPGQVVHNAVPISVSTNSTSTSDPARLLAARRNSLPLKRPLNRHFHSNRRSYVSTSSVAPSLAALQEVTHKRFRPGHLELSGAHSIQSHGASYAATSPPAKRRLSIDQSGPTLSTSHIPPGGLPTGENHNPELKPVFHHSDYLMGVRIEDQEQPAPITTSDPQPLDLSVIKELDPMDEHEQQPSSAKPVCLVQHKSSPMVNSSLLVGLLQTAMNTINSEVHQESQENSLSDQPVELSRTSASLLFAIGTLLIALVDETKSKPITEPIENSPRRPTTMPPPAATDPPVPSAPALSMETNLVQSFNPMTSLIQTSSPMRHSATPYSDLHRASTELSPMRTGNVRGINQFHPTTTGPSILPSTKSDELTYSNVSLPDTKRRSSLLNPPTDGVDLNTPSQASDTGRSSLGKLSDLPPRTVNFEQPPECTIVCPICQFDARWFSELRAHMVNHSAHRMFGCCYCPYRAKWKWDVAKHMRRCPLGRHVAHLSNESLLRIVRYHPPPPGDILYSYFPQDMFPGVGIDRPPTPPEFGFSDMGNRMTLSSGGGHLSEADSVMNGQISGGAEDLTHPPALSRYVSTACEDRGVDTNPRPPTLVRQDVNSNVLEEREEEDSPKTLIIVDADVASPEEKACDVVVGHVTTEKSSPPIAGEFQRTEQSESIATTAASAGLVFRLRKCSQCAFCACDEHEFLAHLALHEKSISGHVTPRSER